MIKIIVLSYGLQSTDSQALIRLPNDEIVVNFIEQSSLSGKIEDSCALLLGCVGLFQRRRCRAVCEAFSGIYGDESPKKDVPAQKDVPEGALPRACQLNRRQIFVQRAIPALSMRRWDFCCSQLYRKAFPALRATRIEYVSAALGRHSGTKTVGSLAFDVAGLERTLHLFGTCLLEP